MSLQPVEWVTRVPGWDYILNHLQRTPVEDHPLKAIVVTERIPRRILGSQPSTGRTTPIVSTPTSLMDISAALEGIDPLTKFAIEEVDPLTAFANEELQLTKNPTSKMHEKDANSWEMRKISILNQFTTSEKISIVTSFLNDDEKVVVKTQSSSFDRVQNKLEQLDYFEEGSQKKYDLSQVEYIKRINLLNKELVMAWNSEQRVKSLKIAIQCAKMLADTEVLHFYPSKFVFITDILDVFGRLVYERLKNKAYNIRPGSKVSTLLDNFTPDMVPETAKETCRNWFYKIASIRELVPRIFVEMAILKSYSFLTSSEYSAALMRLTRMIRGIGNPLVSLYARCYLCRVGLTVTAPGKQTNDFHLENFYDFLKLHNNTLNRSVKQELSQQNMSIATYLTLYTPALDFLLQQVASMGGEGLLQDILERCANINNSSLILNAIMSAFKPSYISQRCLRFLDTIIASNAETEQGLSSGFPLHVLLRTLGLCITVHPPPIEDRKRVLTAVWNQISQIRQPTEYLNCVEPWAQYSVQHFMSRDDDINRILSDIVQHMSQDRAHEQHYIHLKLIVERMSTNVQDIEAFIALDNFLPLIDLFHQELSKVEICKTILNNFSAKIAKINDPIIINTIIYLCSVLHESVNALTIEDEIRQIGELISAIIRKVDFGRDFEQQLSFYVESRGNFCNLCTVLVQLVQCVNKLSVTTRSIVNGHHSRKTAAFVRACAAYCFVTIPSIASTRIQLELYLHSGQVTLFNNCLGQADAFFKTALNILHEVNSNEALLPKNCDDFLLAYIRKFFSVLIVVPDCPDKGVLHLTRILLNFVQNYQWNQTSVPVELYLNVLDMLAIMSQEKYPYYVDKVESNDALYGCDRKFLTELNKISTLALNELLAKIKEMRSERLQSIAAQKLLSIILCRSDVQSLPSLQTVAINLSSVSLKFSAIDSKRRYSQLPTRTYLSRKFFEEKNDFHTQFFAKLHIL